MNKVLFLLAAISISINAEVFVAPSIRFAEHLISRACADVEDDASDKKIEEELERFIGKGFVVKLETINGITHRIIDRTAESFFSIANVSCDCDNEAVMSALASHFPAGSNLTDEGLDAGVAAVREALLNSISSKMKRYFTHPVVEASVNKTEEGFVIEFHVAQDINKSKIAITGLAGLVTTVVAVMGLTKAFGKSSINASFSEENYFSNFVADYNSVISASTQGHAIDEALVESIAKIADTYELLTAHHHKVFTQALNKIKTNDINDLLNKKPVIINKTECKNVADLVTALNGLELEGDEYLQKVCLQRKIVAALGISQEKLNDTKDYKKLNKEFLDYERQRDCFQALHAFNFSAYSALKDIDYTRKSLEFCSKFVDPYLSTWANAYIAKEDEVLKEATSRVYSETAVADGKKPTDFTTEDFAFTAIFNDKKQSFTLFNMLNSLASHNSNKLVEFCKGKDKPYTIFGTEYASVESLPVEALTGLSDPVKIEAIKKSIRFDRKSDSNPVEPATTEAEPAATESNHVVEPAATEAQPVEPVTEQETEPKNVEAHQ